MPSIMGTSLVLHIALYWLCAVTGTVASGEAILGQQESSATAAQLVGVLNAVTAAGAMFATMTSKQKVSSFLLLSKCLCG